MLEILALVLGVILLSVYIAFRRGSLRMMAYITTPQLRAPIVYVMLPFAIFWLYLGTLLELARAGRRLGTGLDLALMGAGLLVILVWIGLRGYRSVPDRIKPAWLLAEERTTEAGA